MSPATNFPPVCSVVFRWRCTGTWGRSPGLVPRRVIAWELYGGAKQPNFIYFLKVQTDVSAVDWQQRGSRYPPQSLVNWWWIWARVVTVWCLVLVLGPGSCGSLENVLHSGRLLGLLPCSSIRRDSSLLITGISSWTSRRSSPISFLMAVLRCTCNLHATRIPSITLTIFTSCASALSVSWLQQPPMTTEVEELAYSCLSSPCRSLVI